MTDHEWVEITVKIPRPIAEWLESLVQQKGWPRHQIVTAGLANVLSMMAGVGGRDVLEAPEEERYRAHLEATKERYREHVEWLVDDDGETHALRIWDLQDPSKEHLLEIAIGLREAQAKFESWIAQDFRALRTPPIEP